MKMLRGRGGGREGGGWQPHPREGGSLVSCLRFSGVKGLEGLHFIGLAFRIGWFDLGRVREGSALSLVSKRQHRPHVGPQARSNTRYVFLVLFATF